MTIRNQWVQETFSGLGGTQVKAWVEFAPNDTNHRAPIAIDFSAPGTTVGHLNFAGFNLPNIGIYVGPNTDYNNTHCQGTTNVQITGVAMHVFLDLFQGTPVPTMDHFG